MKKHVVGLVVAVGVCLGVAAILISPQGLAERHLPSGAESYREDLVSGLWCAKSALVVNALLLLLWPVTVRLWRSAAANEAFRPLFRTEVPALTRFDTLCAVLLFILAVILRFIRSGQSLISDEISIQQMFISRGIPVIMSYMPSMPQHVMYSLMAWFSQKLPLPFEVAYRLPAILAGACAVPLFYMVARRVMHSFVAFAATMLCSVSVYAVVHAQMAKSYTWTHLVVLVWSLLFIALLRRPASLVRWVAMGTCYVVLPFLHLYNLHLVLVLGLTQLVLFAWLSARPSQFMGGARRAVLLGVYCGGVVLLLYSLQLPQIVRLAREVVAQPEEHLSADFWRGWLSQITFWGRTWPLAPACLVLASIGVVSLAFREPRFLLLILFPVAGVIAVVAIRDAFIYPRYMVYALPCFLICLVEGARCLGARAARARGEQVAIAVVSVVFLIPASGALLEYYDKGHQDIRGACEFVTSQAAPADRIVSYGLGKEDFPFYLPAVKPVKSQTELQKVLDRAAGNRVFLLHSYPRVLRRRTADWEYIQEHFEVVRETDGMLMDSAHQDGAVRVLKARR